MNLPTFLRPFSLSLCAAVSLGVAHAETFDYRYEAVNLPEDSVPAWLPLQRKGTAAAGEDGLKVEIPLNARHFYGLGMGAGDKPWGDSGAWDLTGGMATIDLQLRCSTDDVPEAIPTFTLIMRDGTQQWQVNFHSDRIGGQPVDLTEWDTYRVTIRDGLLQLASAKRGVILRDIRGRDDDRGNILMFGTYSYDGSAVSGHRQWELKFLRWTNKVALTELPAAAEN